MTNPARTARLQTQAADALAERMRRLVGTDEFTIIDLAHTYMQFRDLTDEEAVGLHVELPSNHFLPKAKALSADQEAALLEIGFEAPEDEDRRPNWYVMFGYERGVEDTDPDDFDAAIDEVARGAVEALVHVYGFSAELVAGAMGVRMPPRVWVPGPAPKTDRRGLIALPHLNDVASEFARAIVHGAEATDRALYFGFVNKKDTGDLLHLVALAPAGYASPNPVWWQFVAGGWVQNPHLPDMMAWSRHYRLQPLDEATARAYERAMLRKTGIMIAA